MWFNLGLITAGFPYNTLLLETSFVIFEAIPTILVSPIVTPLRIEVFKPKNSYSQFVIHFLHKLDLQNNYYFQ